MKGEEPALGPPGTPDPETRGGESRDAGPAESPPVQPARPSALLLHCSRQ